MVAALATIALVGFVHVRVERPMLLLERFLPGTGWLEVLALGLYAGWVARLLRDAPDTGRVRSRAWRFFSLVFFAQLLIGLAGVEACLMTGKLHLPVPAMIVAGPVFRGEGFFMPILFAVTLVFVGPAWCSHLCYIGAWDDAAARGRRTPEALPAWREWVRFGLLAGVVLVAVVLRLAGASGAVAAALGGAFGLIGVGVMATLSRRAGAMVHCTAYCPIGWLATRLGRISPFRVKIRPGCRDCMRCSRACRYDALGEQDLKRGRPAASCTLCGDCIGSCKWSLLHCSFFGTARWSSVGSPWHRWRGARPMTRPASSTRSNSSGSSGAVGARCARSTAPLPSRGCRIIAGCFRLCRR